MIVRKENNCDGMALLRKAEISNGNAERGMAMIGNCKALLCSDKRRYAMATRGRSWRWNSVEKQSYAMAEHGTEKRGYAVAMPGVGL